MLKRVKDLAPSALISIPKYRSFLETFESETLRGISTLLVLYIINQHGDKGIYGYRLLQELESLSDQRLILEEGRLYPLLRNLEKWSCPEGEIQLIESKRLKVDNRSRKYYFITEEGKTLYSHLEGILTTIMSAVQSVLRLNFASSPSQTGPILYCPNCSNKIDLRHNDQIFCEICGLNVENYIRSFQESQTTLKKDKSKTENNPEITQNAQKGDLNDNKSS